MAKILITGGAGFIGSNLAEKLTEEHDVVILDNVSTGNKSNLPKKIEFINGDICDRNTVNHALKEVQCVLHHAAISSVPISLKDPFQTNHVNILGTLNLLMESSNAEVDRFVYASSSSVYGDEPGMPKNEGMNPSPISPYAVSKVTGEHYCSVFARSFGLSTVSLRYFNVFGPKQDKESEYASVIPLFISAMRGGEPPTVFGDGEQTRDFIYVKDIVLANQKIMESKNGKGDVFNIASGKSQSINSLVSDLNEILGKKIKPIYGEPRAGDVKHSSADVNKVKETFSYSPEWNFRKALEDTVNWFKKN